MFSEIVCIFILNSRFFSDLQRQSSVESTKPGTQKKKVGEDEGVKLHKKIKTNMISLISESFRVHILNLNGRFALRRIGFLSTFKFFLKKFFQGS